MIQLRDNEGKMRNIEFKDGTVFLDGKQNELLENFSLMLGLNIKGNVIECANCGNIISEKLDYCPHCDSQNF